MEWWQNVCDRILKVCTIPLCVTTVVISSQVNGFFQNIATENCSDTLTNSLMMSLGTQIYSIYTSNWQTFGIIIATLVMEMVKLVVAYFYPQPTAVEKRNFHQGNVQDTSGNNVIPGQTHHDNDGEEGEPVGMVMVGQPQPVYQQQQQRQPVDYQQPAMQMVQMAPSGGARQVQCPACYQPVLIAQVYGTYSCPSGHAFTC